MENIIYVIDNRTSIVEEIIASETSIYSFLKDELLKIINKGLLTEVLQVHIHPLMAADRLPIAEEKISLILNG
ncbi:MAG: hypothetical protein KJ578_11975 [Bacteroidetes bacterium]|nr:hypothetical protein [Bacteroidota bacterium]MBU1580753.1 hypothetical protein [Bacteroidota bacterium]MBU2466126.1 hypothetical protein [Bacteroidota bacterium]MBU2558488.1 hypothetical protein [Bacteroidota bacterium]